MLESPVRVSSKGDPVTFSRLAIVSVAVHTDATPVVRLTVQLEVAAE